MYSWCKMFYKGQAEVLICLKFWNTFTAVFTVRYWIMVWKNTVGLSALLAGGERLSLLQCKIKTWAVFTDSDALLSSYRKQWVSSCCLETGEQRVSPLPWMEALERTARVKGEDSVQNNDLQEVSWSLALIFIGPHSGSVRIFAFISLSKGTASLLCCLEPRACGSRMEMLQNEHSHTKKQVIYWFF